MTAPLHKFILWPDSTRKTVAANLHKAVDETPNDAPHVWECRRYRRNRSDEHNSALWAAAYPPIMEHAGLRGERDRLDLHEYFCGEYFGWKVHEIFGRRKLRPRRTTTTDEDGKRDVVSSAVFSDFYGFIQERMAREGVYVPDPDPLWNQKGKDNG